MSNKGKAGPYSVWLMTWSLNTWRHHAYGKLSEAVRVAKKRRPHRGWSFVKNKDGVLVWSCRGFDEIKVKLEDVVFSMVEEKA